MATGTNFLPSGVMAALVTPLHEDGSLDEAAVGRLVERIMAGGADGLSPVGSTGEGALLTREQRLAVTDSLLLASLAMGAVGTIAASVNLVPGLAPGICRAFAEGDLASARLMQARLARIIAACRQGFFPAGWKAALAEAGVCAAHPAPPGTTLSEGERDRLRKVLAAEDVTG